MTVRLVNIAGFMADQHQKEMQETLTQRANEANWTTFFAGVPCVPEIKEFAEGLQKVMPNVKFLPVDQEYVQIPVEDEHGVYQTTKSLRVYSEYAVCLDEFPFDIGRINYRDNGARKKDIKSYGVYSRKITNAKYAYHREQHHMVTATDVKKALKNVSKYFMPYSTKELAQACYDPIRENVAKAGNALTREVRSKADPVLHDHHAIMQEIYWLKKRGVEFSSPKFVEIAKDIEDLMDRYQAEAERSVGAIFVRFYEVSGQTYFSTQHAIEIKKNYSSVCVSAEDRIEGKPVVEIPEDIMGAVSVLSILNNGQYVANVGMKIDEKHFWIERG